jgi:endonuclease YncB( thermonuclease family)
LHKLCKGRTVKAEVAEGDRYGRNVAHCDLPDGRDLSVERVRQGLAINWPEFPGGKYRKLETPDARKKLFLTDARQKSRMHVRERFGARQRGH